MKLLSAYPLSFSNKACPLAFVRIFTHCMVLILLTVYQFIFPFFIHSEVSILIYAFCSFFLFLDMLYLFFYRDSPLFNSFVSTTLSFLDICFFNLLLAVLGFVGLLLVGPFVLLKILILKVSKDWVYSLSFTLLFCTFLPLSFLWHGDWTYDNRRLLVFFITGFLLMSFIGASLLSKMLFLKEDLGKKKDQKSDSSVLFLRSSFYLDTILDFAKKMKPAVDSLYKNFSEPQEQKIALSSKYKNQLHQLQNLIQKSIEYFELKKTEELETVFLKPLLEKLLKQAKDHKTGPAHLEEQFDYQASIEWIKGSKQQLERAFYEVIENALQALKNTKNPQLQIFVYEENQRLVIAFVDNGQGIDTEDQAQLFKPFFSKKLGLSGGLGLSYVLKVVEFHQGEIQIKKSILGGTEVAIKLPFFTQEEPDLIA